MKKIETIINEHAFQSVRDLLISEGRDIVVSEVRAEHDRKHILTYRGIAYDSYESRLKIETVVSDAEAMPLVHEILTVARESDSTDAETALSNVENVQSIGITKLTANRAQPLPRGRDDARAPLPEPSR